MSDRTEHHILPPGDRDLLAMLRDTRLSYAARGLLLVVMDNPTITPHRDWLTANTPEPRARVQEALKELTDAGYRLVENHKNADGTWTHRVTWSAVPR